MLVLGNCFVKRFLAAPKNTFVKWLSRRRHIHSSDTTANLSRKGTVHHATAAFTHLVLGTTAIKLGRSKPPRQTVLK